MSYFMLSLCTTTQAQELQKVPLYQKMTLRLPFSTEEKEYMVQKEGHYFILNGDIIVGNDFPNTMSYGHKDQDYQWTNGTIPIAISPSIFEKNLQNVVYQAIDEYNQKTEICMVPYTGQDDYIMVEFNDKISGSGQSPVGRQGGEQKLFLNNNAPFGTVVHELLHAVGIWHEQSRSDRNNFVKILEENVRGGTENNFQIEPGTISGGYDYCSIMHYSQMAFSKNGANTIQCLTNGSITPCPSCLGQRNGLSQGDIRGIDQLYSSVSRFPCQTRFPRPSDTRKDANVTAVSATKGGATLFTVGEDGGVWSTYYDSRVANPKWEAWFPLGGKVRPGTQVTAVSTVEGGISLFVVGLDDAIWSAYYDPRVANPKWTDWFSLGGKARAGTTISAVSAAYGSVSLFIVGANGSVWSKYFDARVANAKWSDWFSLGGGVKIGSDIAAISTVEGGISLFVVGLDDAVWSSYFDPRIPNAKWVDWFSLGGKIRAGNSVTAVSASKGSTSLFVVGMDNTVWSRYFDARIPNAKWVDWFSLGGIILGGTEISAVSAVEGGISLFGVSTDNGAWSAYFDPRVANAKWTDWFTLGARGLIRNRATIQAISPNAGGVSLFSVNSAAQVFSAYYDPRVPNAKWSEWFRL